MEFLFKDHGAKQTIFLLHGTGGDEHDLLSLVEPLGTQYNVVSLRGRVKEQGMNRFFKRKAMGVFDQESIKVETDHLAEWLADWYKKQQLSVAKTAFVGYSNGANMVLATLWRYPKLINNGVLFHPMLPFEPAKTNLKNKRFLVTYGMNDPLIAASESIEVVEALKNDKAEVETVVHSGGHEVRKEEVEALIRFLS